MTSLPAGGEPPMDIPTPLDQGAFLEAIGINPAEVERNSIELVFEEDMIRVRWIGMKYVPVGKLMFALTEADEEMKRRGASVARAKATPAPRKRSYAAEAAEPEEDR